MAHTIYILSACSAQFLTPASLLITLVDR